MGVFQSWVLRSGGFDGVLTRTAARTLAGDHYSLKEELTAPDAPGLSPLERAGQAQGLDRAIRAQSLRVLHVRGGLGEEELRVVHSARQLLIVENLRRVMEPAQGGLVELVTVENADVHVSPPLMTLIAWVLLLGVKTSVETERPRIPGFGFRGLEAAEC